MMELLVFLVLLFGLFGVISAQYLIQYREAYALWIKEIVYARGDEPSEKRQEFEDIALIRLLFRNKDALNPHP